MVELYVKKRALYYAAKGLNPSAISRALGEEGQQYSCKSVPSLLRRVRETGGFSRKPGSTKITQRVKDLIEEEMQKDDQATASQLGHPLHVNGIGISRTTILRCRRQLGWTFRGSAYCQLIREVNREKRLTWCQENLNVDFSDVMRQPYS